MSDDDVAIAEFRDLLRMTGERDRYKNAWEALVDDAVKEADLLNEDDLARTLKRLGDRFDLPHPF